MLSKKIRIVLWAFIAIIVLTAGVIAQHYYTLSQTPKIATVLPEPREIVAFTLKDGQSKPFNNQRLRDHWTLLFFGFTRCPMICPTAMTTLKQAYELLAKQKQQPMPQVVFVSVDPERDSPRKTDQYAKGFHPEFIGVTGQSAELKKFMAALTVLAMKVKQPTENNYTIDHSSTILLLNPQGKLAAIFSMPYNATEIAEDYKKIAE